jgi:hypothetical protein
MDCPDGTHCMGGFCRTTTSGQCPAAGGDANDACIGAPASPPNCSTRFALEGNACAVLCALTSGGDERDFGQATQACNNGGWQLGILDTPGKLSAIMTSQGLWIGATRIGTPGAWMWLDGTPIDSNAWVGATPPLTGSSCASYEGSLKRLNNSTNCGDNDKYLCTFPKRP